MTARLTLLCVAALLLVPAAGAKRMLPERVRASDPAWRVEQKQLANLAYARRVVKPHTRGPELAPQAVRWYRHAAAWIGREHQELVYRVIGPWIPTYRCEKGSAGWATNTGNGFYGGLQFDYGTWLANGGGQFARTANLATPIQQVTVASRLTYDGWPNCPNP